MLVVDRSSIAIDPSDNRYDRVFRARVGHRTWSSTDEYHGQLDTTNRMRRRDNTGAAQRRPIRYSLFAKAATGYMLQSEGSKDNGRMVGVLLDDISLTTFRTHRSNSSHRELFFPLDSD